MSEWDKNLIAQAFSVAGEENTECTILVATDAYGMGINNPDVRLVIQWDIPISFDSMIQRMGRVGRRGRASVFILLTPKWTKIKDLAEIEKCTNGTLSSTSANAQLSNNNRPKLPSKISLLNQVVNTNDDLSELESIARSEADVNFAKGADFFLGALATDAEQDHFKKKKEKQASEIDAAKRAKLSNEIFDYIHVARCQRLFSLA